MTLEEARKELESYRTLAQNAHLLKCRIHEREDALDGHRFNQLGVRIQISAMEQQGNKLERHAKIIDLKQELCWTQNKMDAIVWKISRLESPHNAILRYCYIDRKNTKQLMDIINYSKRQIMRDKVSALLAYACQPLIRIDGYKLLTKSKKDGTKWHQMAP